MKKWVSNPALKIHGFSQIKTGKKSKIGPIQYHAKPGASRATGAAMRAKNTWLSQYFNEASKDNTEIGLNKIIKYGWLSSSQLWATARGWPSEARAAQKQPTGWINDDVTQINTHFKNYMRMYGADEKLRGGNKSGTRPGNAPICYTLLDRPRINRYKEELDPTFSFTSWPETEGTFMFEENGKNVAGQPTSGSLENYVQNKLQPIFFNYF